MLDLLNKPKELEYIAKKKQESKAFKNFIRGIHNDTTKSNYTEWLRNDIMKFAHFQKIISEPEEYDELIKLGIYELDVIIRKKSCRSYFFL